MGTEKYPDENEYNTYLVSHGGGSNAYTDTEDTNYYFDVLADHFEGAIDRFAQFFVAPLFTPSATERELKAVDSENSKNCQNDFWRSFQLLKSLAREDHPFHKFGTGNLETIKDDEETGESVRDALLNFHATFYSADVMKLVLVGKETLDELQNYASKYFSDIANKDVGNPSFPGAPYPPSHLGKRIEVVPIKEVRLDEERSDSKSSILPTNITNNPSRARFAHHRIVLSTCTSPYPRLGSTTTRNLPTTSPTSSGTSLRAVSLAI